MERCDIRGFPAFRTVAIVKELLPTDGIVNASVGVADYYVCILDELDELVLGRLVV